MCFVLQFDLNLSWSGFISTELLAVFKTGANHFLTLMVLSDLRNSVQSKISNIHTITISERTKT